MVEFDINASDLEKDFLLFFPQLIDYISSKNN